MATAAHVTVDAIPYVWPCDGDIRVRRTALINIDWQVDFAGEGGFYATDLDLILRGSGIMQGGVFGAHATSAAVLEAFDRLREKSAPTTQSGPTDARVS